MIRTRPGTAEAPGASAQREFERRAARRRHQVLMHHPFADKDAVRGVGRRRQRYSGRRVIWPPEDGREMLAIRGRDRTHLVDGLAQQVAIVEAAVAQCATPAPVHGALCFVQTELPAGRRLMFEAIHLLDAARLAKRINTAAPHLDPQGVLVLAEEIERRFPPA